MAAATREYRPGHRRPQHALRSRHVTMTLKASDDDVLDGQSRVRGIPKGRVAAEVLEQVIKRRLFDELLGE